MWKITRPLKILRIFWELSKALIWKFCQLVKFLHFNSPQDRSPFLLCLYGYRHPHLDSRRSSEKFRLQTFLFYSTSIECVNLKNPSKNESFRFVSSSTSCPMLTITILKVKGTEWRTFFFLYYKDSVSLPIAPLGILFFLSSSSQSFIDKSKKRNDSTERNTISCLLKNCLHK